MVLNFRFLLALALGSAIAIEVPRQPKQPLGNGTRLLAFNDTIPSARLRSNTTSIDWFAGGEDGVGVTLSDEGDLVLQDFVTGNTSILVPAGAVPSDYWEYFIQPSLERVLFSTNYTKQYRHSYFADYVIYDVASNETLPLDEEQQGDVQYASWAPIGNSIAFVRGNNLYISNGSEVTQITSDGGPDILHAVPDWVYEEEIFGVAYSFWWSPDANYLAYLSFNETGVGTFSIPYYMHDRKIASPYPSELELRYPKVGTTNPTVQFTLLDIQTLEGSPILVEAFEANDTIIGEVAWVTGEHSSVLLHVFNRVQDMEKYVLVDVESGNTSTVRERDGSDGWLDNNLAITYIGSVNGSNETWYVDLSDESGWNHLYLFPVVGGDNVTLTSGEWEVTDILSVDSERELIYYRSTTFHSTSRHVYSVSYTTGEITPLVNDEEPAYYSASFSPSGGYYLLSYQGPDVPYQDLYSTDSSEPLSTITSNSVLHDAIQEYNLPNITYFELQHPDGYTLNVMQRLPPNFNSSHQYPVLFIPYGGPGAQEVSQTFSALNFKAYIASDPELAYITYTVDGRGTGYKGRAFRAIVASHLGRYEPLDQIWAAEQIISSFSYVNPEKFGIWGWSFGGYLSAKVVELQGSGGPFSLGLITAPVTDWRFYDSMYTERYMKTSTMNEAGYNETAVRNATGFKDIRGGFAIMHGTGDDNVHYQNTAALIDLLVAEGVTSENMDMFAFTDSDHSINYNGATTYIYKYLSKLLWEEVQRVPAESLAHQWSKRKVVAREWVA
ncbi:dipeptidyl-peptidase 4 [Exophiala aquamarina CBS 119918]|uniref:dipeptidyl-peptidase IV n=1 Tax=Exophiala aquamarina CBS 119918 TaxID=1182545 RepID=A0A072PUE3_9EURO|nr:dipeptidyl-peptidase 4 [Exophiala aquamarina CBS 119918]KEF63347.1 dipeptidyl-peptidase 4 [Exophiala aquamarina CBS 119918]